VPSKKGLSGEVVVHLLEQMLEGQDRLRVEMIEGQDRLRVGIAEGQNRLGEKIDAVVAEQRVTNTRFDRLEKAVIGIGRITKLESRVRRLEEQAGLDPTRG
jgi:hypothetical protein